MRYNVIKDANRIINKSPYLINNPEDYKNKWSILFENCKCQYQNLRKCQS